MGDLQQCRWLTTARYPADKREQTSGVRVENEWMSGGHGMARRLDVLDRDAQSGLAAVSMLAESPPFGPSPAISYRTLSCSWFASVGCGDSPQRTVYKVR